MAGAGALASGPGLTAVWEFARPFAAASKWRRVTVDQRERQVATWAMLRRDTAALEMGGATVPKVRRRPTAGPAPSFGTAEADELRAFLSKHWCDIAGLLAEARDEDQQLDLARGYSAVRAGVPDAYDGWIALLQRLSE